MKWFCNKFLGDTKEPGVKLFRRFQTDFLEIEKIIKEEDLVRLDLSLVPDWVKELIKETIAWTENLKQTKIFPRDDYKEMLDWNIYHYGAGSKVVYPLKVPGPDHSARWMSKCIYYAKLLACSKVFKMSYEEVSQAQSVKEFWVLFY